MTLTFAPDGTLTYAIHGSDRQRIILLTYRTEGNEMVTDQPSEPREERATDRFGEDGKLLLTMGGLTSRFIRVS